MTTLREQVEDPNLSPFERLVKLLAILRSPEGCNWDRKQTHQSLVPYLVEEAYEVIDAIETGHPEDLKEELGDLAVQIVFHGQLAAERGEFTIDDSIANAVAKLVHRHPHVFGEKKDLSPQQVRDQWEKIKTDSGEKETVLGGLPKSMPALTMAFRIGEKAGGTGFDWKQAADVLDKIDEELAEVRQEIAAKHQDKEKLMNEIGDLLFAVASLSRKLDIEPETALRAALKKFRSRFDELEKRVQSSGNKFSDISLDELETIWQQVKNDQRTD